MHSLHESDGWRAKGADGVLMLKSLPFNLTRYGSGSYNEKIATSLVLYFFPVSLQLYAIFISSCQSAALYHFHIFKVNCEFQNVFKAL
jgi:hypothetical protein